MYLLLDRMAQRSGENGLFDFRDMSGKVQGVVLPGSLAIDVAKICRSEWVVSVQGKVNSRPEKLLRKINKMAILN